MSKQPKPFKQTGYTPYTDRNGKRPGANAAQNAPQTTGSNHPNGKTAYYVIPVDRQGNAYLGLKAMKSPYEGRDFCQGCPVVFGGNKEKNQTRRQTLIAEVKQDSHEKFDLTNHLTANELKQIHIEEENKSMVFYYLAVETVQLTAGVEDRTIRSWADPKKKKSYLETTGDVLTIDLTKIGTTEQDKEGAAALLIKTGCEASGVSATDVTGKSKAQFKKSATLEAIQRAAVEYQNRNNTTTHTTAAQVNATTTTQVNTTTTDGGNQSTEAKETTLAL